MSKKPPARSGKAHLAAKPSRNGKHPATAGAGARTSSGPLQVNGVLPLTQIRPCPFNVRQRFDDADLRELADSIDAVGLKDPLLVRPVPRDGSAVDLGAPDWHKAVEYFELADGERRFRALSLLADDKNIPPVPVIVRQLSDEEMRVMMLVSREQSRDLSVSELVAGYVELRAAVADDATLALKVGKSVGHVRGILRLAKLPAWALAAVDAGTLPRATAELVARVPGEESRKKAAACVVAGLTDPRDLEGVVDFSELPDGHWNGNKWNALVGSGEPLSYRDTKDLIRNHFQVELKGAPFDRKSLDLLPEAGSCEACPKRAGNDPEAVAEGTRADVCLDPDCYRAKVNAYRARELAKAEDKGIKPVPDDFSWYTLNGKPPTGWFDPKAKLCECGDVYDACVMPASDDRRQMPLDKLLNKLLPQQYLAFDREGKARKLLRAADVRAVLCDLGVIPAPKEPRPGKAAKESLLVSKSDPSGITKPPAIDLGPSWREVTTRVARIAGGVAFEMGCENADGLEGLTALGDSTTNAAWESLKLLATWQAEEFCEEGDLETHLSNGVTGAVDYWGRDDWEQDRSALASWKSWIDRADPAHLIGFLLKAAMFRVCTARLGSLDRTRQAILDWCELDWDALEKQARRELAGGESAEEKIAKAEQAQAETETESSPPEAGERAAGSEACGLKAEPLAETSPLPTEPAGGIEVIKGEPIDPLGLKADDLDQAVCCDKIGRPADKKAKVLPTVTINTMPYVVLGASYPPNEGSQPCSWIIRPLWTERQFANRFPGFEFTEEREIKDRYLGVPVYLGKGQKQPVYRVGARGEERRLIEFPHRPGKKKEGGK